MLDDVFTYYHLFQGWHILEPCSHMLTSMGRSETWSRKYICGHTVATLSFPTLWPDPNILGGVTRCSAATTCDDTLRSYRVENWVQFLDHLERLSEGKPLQVNDSFEDIEESSKDYILHSWLTPLRNDNYSNKCIHVFAALPPLWRSRTGQSKAVYLYDDKSKEGEWWFSWL